MKTFQEFLNEAIKPRKVRFVAFDIFIDNNKEFSSNADNAADIIDRKLKTNKFKDRDNIQIIRHTEDGSEDVTNLFLK